MPVTTLAFTPHEAAPMPNPGGQAAFASDWTHRLIAAEGGWGSGKTWIGARKLITLHCYNAVDPATQRPTGVPSVIVGPTYRNVIDIDLPAIEAACADANLTVEVRMAHSSLRFPDLGTRGQPSEIMVRSADKPELITGWEVGALWGDEPTRWKENRANPRGDPFVQCLGRIRHPRARFLQGIFTYTPEGDATRVYEEFSSGKADYALYRIRTHENPLMLDFEEAQRRMLTPELARQYLDGECISLRGRNCYSAYTPTVNDSPDAVLRPGVPVCVFIDFNVDPGMYFGFGQYHKGEDVFSVAGEIHEPRLDVRRGVPKVAAAIGAAGGLEKFGGTLDIYGDATGRSGWAGTSETVYQILRQALDKEKIPYRMHVPQSNPLQHDRVNAVCVAMFDVEGKVHVRLNAAKCPVLKRDLMQVRWNDQGSGIDKSNPLLTHASDALGYWVHYVRPARLKSVVVGGRFGV